MEWAAKVKAGIKVLMRLQHSGTNGEMAQSSKSPYK